MIEERKSTRSELLHFDMVQLFKTPFHHADLLNNMALEQALLESKSCENFCLLLRSSLEFYKSLNLFPLLTLNGNNAW